MEARLGGGVREKQSRKAAKTQRNAKKNKGSVAAYGEVLKTPFERK